MKNLPGFSARESAALAGAPGICRVLDESRSFMCDLDEGHEGDHCGFELPTIEIDEDF